MSAKNRAYVITNPMVSANRSTEVTLSKFLRVIRPCFMKVTVIGGNIATEADLKDVEIYAYRMKRAENRLKRILYNMALQLKMSVTVMRRVKMNELVFFWVGDKMIVPYISAKVKQASILFFVYGNVAKEGNRPWLSHGSAQLIRFMANHSDFICVESKSVLDEWDGQIAGKTKTIHLYSEEFGFQSLDDRMNTVGMVCRLAEGKRVVESIRAFCLLHEAFPGWTLEIIGSGRQFEACTRTVDALNATAFIHLLGWVEHGRIKDIAKKWKYLLFPTDAEGMPNGLIEMMGHGIPAIASPVGGIRDVIVHGQNGWTLKGISVTEIHDGLMEALRAPDYPSVAAAAYNAIIGEYTLEKAQQIAIHALL